MARHVLLRPDCQVLVKSRKFPRETEKAGEGVVRHAAFLYERRLWVVALPSSALQNGGGGRCRESVLEDV